MGMETLRSTQTVLLVHESGLDVLHDRLSSDGYAVVRANPSLEGVHRGLDRGPDAILVDLDVCDGQGSAILHHLVGERGMERPPCLVLGTPPKGREYQHLFTNEARVEFSAKPIEPEAILTWLSRIQSDGPIRLAARDDENEARRLSPVSGRCRIPGQAPRRADAKGIRESLRELMGQSEVVREIEREVEQVAKSNLSVVITGETGVGKELVARAIHDASPKFLHSKVGKSLADCEMTLARGVVYCLHSLGRNSQEMKRTSL